jgi:hypothetical protein
MTPLRRFARLKKPFVNI